MVRIRGKCLIGKSLISLDYSGFIELVQNEPIFIKINEFREFWFPEGDCLVIKRCDRNKTGNWFRDKKNILSDKIRQFRV